MLYLFGQQPVVRSFDGLINMSDIVITYKAYKLVRAPLKWTSQRLGNVSTSLNDIDLPSIDWHSAYFVSENIPYLAAIADYIIFIYNIGHYRSQIRACFMVYI